MSTISIQNLSQKYMINNKEFFALQDITLNLHTNKISVILGKSGAGKTTLLRLISGLELASAGTIHTNSNLNCKVVFQEARLMPWLNVEENIKFWNNSSADKLLELMNLTAFRTLFPKQISGGMAQKVALARALHTSPDIILMDEPFASLDYFSRRDLQFNLLTLQNQKKLGIIFITHNIDEAVLLADEIFVLNKGQLALHVENTPIIENRENTPFSNNLKKRLLSTIEGI